MHTDVEDLLKKLEGNTSDECCFNNHNITTVSLLFEVWEDPAAKAQQFFVRQLHK